MHFFSKIGLDKFGNCDGRGVEISGSPVCFLSLSKSHFKVTLVLQPLWEFFHYIKQLHQVRYSKNLCLTTLKDLFLWQFHNGCNIHPSSISFQLSKLNMKTILNTITIIYLRLPNLKNLEIIQNKITYFVLGCLKFLDIKKKREM